MVVIAAFAALPVLANAQRVTALAAPFGDTSHSRETNISLSGAAADSSGRRVFWTRVATGSVGWFLGVVAGAYVASALPQHDCQCDDPGLDQALYGALIGSVVVSAAGAAHLSIRHSCSYVARFGRGLIGSLAGTVIAVAATVPVFSPAAVVALPVGASAGAAFAIGDC